MIQQTYTARKRPKTATKWTRPLLLHAVCSERMPCVGRHPGGIGSAKRVFSLVTLTFDLGIRTRAIFL